MQHLPITNDKRQVGISNLGETAPLFQMVEFDAVFDRDFTSDVHFVCYGLIETGTTAPTANAFPRIRKAALPTLREAGAEVVVGCLTLDFDLKDQEGIEDLPLSDSGKPTWTAEELASFQQYLPTLDAALLSKRIAAPLVYTTNHGARFVHHLTAPVVCEDSEDLLRGLQKVYRDLGLILDPLCDWTRLFRAPNVIRDGKRTGDQRWFFKRDGVGTTDADAIDPVSKNAAYKDRYERVEVIESDKPTPEEAHGRLFTTGASGGEIQTDMRKLAARILKGTPSYGACFEQLPIAEEGSRDSTLIKLVGSATTHLLGPQSGHFEFQPEDIYALFLDAVEQLDADSGTPDWTEALWSKVKTCYEREKAKVQGQALQHEEKKEQAQTNLHELLRVVRQTCGLPDLHSSDPVTAATALSRMLLLKDPSGKFRAFTPEGDITKIAVPQNSLHSLVRVAGLTQFIDLFVTNKKNEVVIATEQSIARQHAIDVISIAGVAGADRSFIRGDDPCDLQLVLSLYRRSPRLDPIFHQDVDEWLELLTDDPHMLRRWLAYALHFEGGPIAALSLAGAPGAGKGMLCQGLIETLETPVSADKSALVGDFNATLKDTPFLIVDEGLPTGKHDIADTFRILTGGGGSTINEKYQAPVRVRNPMRLIFTANNLDVVEQLASHRMNDPKDQAALAARLLHLDVQEAAEIHLRARGGLAFTKGWVEGADGARSDFKLAEHLLWLYANRDRFGEPDTRFLVEGKIETEVVQGMRIANRQSQAIARAIVVGLEDGVIPAVLAGLAIEKGHLFVTSKAIEEQHRQMHESNVQLNPVIIGRALRNMLTPHTEDKERSWHKALSGEKSRQRWRDVDVRLLWTYAEDAGYKRDKLKELVIGQYGPGEVGE